MRSQLTRLAACASLVSLAFVTACSCDSSSPFGKPSRGVTLGADVTDPTTGVVTHVFADLSEIKDNVSSRELSVSVNDQVIGVPNPLAGHLKHLRVLDGSMQPVQEIKLFPGTPTTNSILTETVFFDATQNARYDAMRTLFLSGTASVELETDLPGREIIRIPFMTIRANDWATSSCD